MTPTQRDELLRRVTQYMNEWEGVRAGPGGGPDLLKLEMARALKELLTRPEAQGEWVQYAFAALGFMRDKMDPDDVTTIQDFLDAAQQGVTKP